MKKFLDFDGLRLFLANIKTIFVAGISEGSTSGSFQYTTYEKDATATGGIKVKTVSVPVHNVLTTDTAQNISATKTVTTGNKLVLVDAPVNDTDAANKAYVDSMISASDAMVYKGTLGTGGTITTLPTDDVTNGDTYKVITDGTYAGQAATVGDLFIAKYTDDTPSVLEWTLIPSGKTGEVYLKYGTTVSGINDSEFKTGQIVLGDTVSKTVATAFNGNYSTDVSNNNNLPTVGAVTAYALKEVKNATSDSSLTIGTKASGEQTLAVKVKANSGITSDSNGLSANVDTNSGLSIDSTSGAIKLNTPGNGIKVDNTNHKITANIDTTAGLKFIGSNEGSKKIGVNAGSGLKFDENNGKLIVDTSHLAGNGLTGVSGTFDIVTGAGLIIAGSAIKVDNGNGITFNDDNQLIVDIESLAGSGIEADTQDIKIQLSRLGSGSSDPFAGLKFNTETAMTTPGLAINNGNGITFDNNGKLIVDTQNLAGSGLTINENTKALRIKLGSNAGLVFDDTDGLIINTSYLAGDGLTSDDNNYLNINTGNGIEISSGAVTAKANTDQGIEVTSDGIGIALASAIDIYHEEVNTSGLTFDNGKLQVQANTARGIEITHDGVSVYLGCGAGGLMFNNDNALVVSAGSGITVASEVKVNNGNGLTFNNGSLTIDTGDGLTFDGEGKLQVNTSNVINVDDNNQLTIQLWEGFENGLSLFQGCGLGLNLAVASTGGQGGSAGAMSATDKEKLDNLSTSYANKLDAEQGTGADAGKVKLNLKNNAQSVSTLDTVNLSSANKALSLTASNAQSGTDTNLEFAVNVNEHNGLKVDSSTGIKLDVDTTAGLKETASGNKLAINNGNGITFGNDGKLNVNAGDGLTFNDGQLTINPGAGLYLGSDNHLLDVSVDSNKGLDIVGQIGSDSSIVIKNGSGINFDDNGALIVNIGSDYGLKFDNNNFLIVDYDVVGDQLAGDGLTYNTTNNELNINAGSGLLIDTYNNKLNINAGSGLTFDGRMLQVDAGDGLKLDNAGTLNVWYDGHTIDNVGSGNSLTVITGDGLDYSDNGVCIKLLKGDNNTNLSGLAFTDGAVAVNVDSNNSNGLSVGANGLTLATATPSTSGTGGSAGAMSAQDKEKLNTLDAATTVGKNGITVTKTGNETDIAADINTTKGLAFTGDTEGSKKIGVNVLTNSGLGFDNTTGGLYLESITDTEINNLFNPQQAG